MQTDKRFRAAFSDDDKLVLVKRTGRDNRTIILEQSEYKDLYFLLEKKLKFLADDPKL